MDSQRPPSGSRRHGPVRTTRPPWKARLYDTWNESGAFQPSDDPERRPFTIAIPPPNITGQLHNGHVLFVAYQDLMIRWQRMHGRAALWVPGTDHAAIATQNVIERELDKEGLTRHDLGREGFEDAVLAVGRTTSATASTISCGGWARRVDWTREHFTLDEQLSRAVREAFVRLYEKGLIYRGRYMVNWCPDDQSAISDLEVDYLDVEGSLWHIRYPLVDGGHLTVATTRPGDDAGRHGDCRAPGRRALPGADWAGSRGAGYRSPGSDHRRHLRRSRVRVRGGQGHAPGTTRTTRAMGERHDLPVINIMNGDGDAERERGTLGRSGPV